LSDMITALLYINVHEFIEALVRKIFSSERPIIGIIIYSTITNLTDRNKLILTIMLRLNFTNFMTTDLQIILN